MKLRRGRFTGLIAAACLTIGHGAAWGQEATPTAQDAASNVTPYKPDFFTQYRPNTAMDMIGRIPGFTFSDSGNGRGFSGTAGNVLIDGERPPSRSDSLSSIIGRIPASGVERIDIIRGGADGIDMQGQPIVANIIRKPDAGLTGAVNANINVNEAGNISPNASIQMRSQANGQLLDGSISVLHNTGSGESVGRRTDPLGVVIRQSETNNRSSFDRVNATGSWETTWLGGNLRINGLAQLERSEFEGVDELIIPGGSQINTGKSHSASGEAGIRYSRSLDGGFALEVVGFQSLWNGELEGAFNTSTFTSGDASDDEAGESIFRTTLTLPTLGDWSFEAGGEVVYNFQGSERARMFNGAPFILDGDDYRVDEVRAESFGTATWSPAAALKVEMGARYEWSRITADVGSLRSQKELMYLKPRVNVSWTPEQGHQLGFRVERTVDQLDFDSFASSAAFEQEVFGVGNADLEPEKIWAYVGRYERQFGGQNSLVVTLTHETFDDVLGRGVIVVPATMTDPELELEITRNTGTATRDALEFKSSFELDGLGMPGGVLTAGGTLYESSVTDPVTGEEHRNSDESPWYWNVSLQQTLGDGDFRWGLFLQDSGDTSTWTPRQFTKRHAIPFVGANLTWKPADGWTFGAGVNAIFDDNQTVDSIFYTARRGVGVPQYYSHGENTVRRQFFVNVRKNF